MAEVCVQCVECDVDLDIVVTELKWGAYYLKVIPCPNCCEEEE